MANLELRGVSKYFGKAQALADVCLTVDDGEFVSLVGPSGCGKTTLLRIIAGLETATQGDVVIGDRLVNTLDPAERNIAMVFQSYALYPHKTVFENIAFPLRMRSPWFTRIPWISHVFPTRKTLESRLQHQVPKTAALLHLESLLKRKPGQLSGGQRQRVALARAMVRDPELFLMDEPLSNLDAKLRADMRAEIIELQRRVGGTFIYVTHDQSEAMTMSDRVVLMHQGCIQQIGAPSELYDNPENLFVAEFIGSPKINTLQAQSLTYGTVQAFGCQLRQVPDRIDNASLSRNPSFFLCVRPEALRLVNADTPDAVVGIVHILENLGNEFLVIVHPDTHSTSALPLSREGGSSGLKEVGQSEIANASEAKLVMRVNAAMGRQLKTGDRVYLQPDWTQVLLFNSEGFRLSHAESSAASQTSSALEVMA